MPVRGTFIPRVCWTVWGSPVWLAEGWYFFAQLDVYSVCDALAF